MFPKGFLWDADGWIAREQIIGEEAEFATPADFITQYPHIANPPTTFMVMSRFVDMLQGTTKYYDYKL
jgi:mannosyl-oligosaccharide glucosidase